MAFIVYSCPDSPLHMPGAFPVAPTTATVAAARTRTFIELSDDEDSDVELLADTLKTVQICTAGGL